MTAPPRTERRERRREQGVVLVLVLVFALLLTASIATFLRRSAVDAMISHNRESMARAEGLARGGVRLAVAVLVEDALRAQQDPSGAAVHTLADRWATLEQTPIEEEDGARLRVRIRDTGARINLNALFGDEPAADTLGVDDDTTLFLRDFLQRVIDDSEMPPGERALYDASELAASLRDYVDADEVRANGGAEDEYYQRQDPPYRPANRPLLSVEELRLVEGFDGKLVNAILPYVTVYPYTGGGGINVNTAPPHVLYMLFYKDNSNIPQLADEDLVERILAVREEGRFFCPLAGDTESDLGRSSQEDCEDLRGIMNGVETVHPPLEFSSSTFEVVAQARVGDVTRSVETVIDLGDPAAPLLLSWAVR